MIPFLLIFTTGGSRMISDGFDLIKLPYLPYVFGKTFLGKQFRPDQTPQNAASNQGLHYLPLTQQFYANSQVVKLICWREV